MSADPELIQQVEVGMWRPHWLTPIGTVAAIVACVGVTVLLFGFGPALEAWLRTLKTGGLVGGSNTPDRINGLRIIAGFCGMMSVVGSVMLVRARAQRQRLSAALRGAPGVVWLYRERATVAGEAEHVFVFGLEDGVRLRATIPAETSETLWNLAIAAFPGASRGHDSQQERRFATRPQLLAAQPRVVDGIQPLQGKSRAR